MIRSVQIGPLTFDIKYQDGFVIEEGNQASCCIDDLTITLSRTPLKVLQLKYLVHEMLEAYNILYDLKLQHQQINQLETIFFDIITSNRHLTEEIEEEI